PAVSGHGAHTEPVEVGRIQRLPLFRRDAGPLRGEGERTVEGTGIEVPESEAPGDFPRSRAVAAACGAVDRAGHRQRAVQNPGKLTCTQSGSSTTIRLPGSVVSTPNAMAMR